MSGVTSVIAAGLRKGVIGKVLQSVSAGEADCPGTVIKTAGKIRGRRHWIGFSSGMETVLDQCLELMACHGAIRANQKLSDKEIEKLLHQLDTCDQPSNCPHGRPTWIRIGLKELEKMFKRIV